MGDVIHFKGRQQDGLGNRIEQPFRNLLYET
jgi:hypothetical protein